MDTQKAANWSQILSVVPGTYSAYVTYIIRNPPDQPNIASEGVRLLGSSASLISFGAFLALLIVGFILRLFASKEPDPTKLIIHYARYGVGDWFWQYRNRARIVRGFIKNGDSLDMVMGNTNFADPFRGQVKYTTVKYSLGGVTRVITLSEGERLVIPDNAVRKMEPARTAVSNAPSLLLRYVPRSRLNIERLVFINDGPGAVIEPTIGPLKWSDQREIGVLGDTGTLEAGGRDERDIWVVETHPGNNRELFDLRDFMVRKTPNDAEVVVTATYKDSIDRRFARDFILTTQADGGITWKPCPVRCVSVMGER